MAIALFGIDGNQPSSSFSHSLNSADLVRLLTAAVSKSDLRDRNKRGLTPLAEAVLAGARDAAAALVSAGASVADADCRGWPLLTTTAAAGNADAVKWALKAGADVGAAGPGGVTALHAAASAASTPTIRALLDAGADVDATDADGRAPVDVLPADAPAALKSSLARTAAAKPPPAAAVTAGAFSSAASAFAALSPADRIATATRWAALDDDDALEAATAPYPTAVFTHAQHARTARHKLTIHKAVCMLHDDDDWQEWAGLDRVKAAVAAVRDDPAAVERYMRDPPTMHVLTGLKKLQAVAAVNGRHGVPFDALLTANCASSDWRAVDAETLAALRSIHDAHVAAAAAAAAEDDEVEATKAAKRVMDAFEKKNKGGGGGGGEAAASTAAPSAEQEVDTAEPSLKQRLIHTIMSAVVRALIMVALFQLVKLATAPKPAGKTEL